MTTEPTADLPSAAARHPGDIGFLLFSFEGRVPRTAYLLWMAIVCVIMVILHLAAPGNRTAFWVAGLILLWPHYAIAIKRFHDRDKSGWWVLLRFIPIIGQIWVFIELGFFPGTPGPNRFGNPLR